MTAFLIVLAILGLLYLVAMIPCRLHVAYKEELSLSLRVLGIPLRRYPAKKKRVKISDYSQRALECKRKKALKRAAKKSKRKKATTPRPTKERKRDTAQSIVFLRRFLKILLQRSLGYLKVSVRRISVKVATDDPAKTAILFGVVNSAALYLLEALDAFGKFGGKKRAVLYVQPDFTATQTEVDIALVLSLRIWQILAILFRTTLTQLENQKNVK